MRDKSKKTNKKTVNDLDCWHVLTLLDLFVCCCWVFFGGGFRLFGVGFFGFSSFLNERGKSIHKVVKELRGVGSDCEIISIIIAYGRINTKHRYYVLIYGMFHISDRFNIYETKT